MGNNSTLRNSDNPQEKIAFLTRRIECLELDIVGYYQGIRSLENRIADYKEEINILQKEL
jgi:hypothetical protein